MPTITLPDGTVHDISWPPESPNEWEVLARYFQQQNDFLHKLLRAVVSLEKKAHWGIPTQAVMKTKCPYECRDPETGRPKDPASNDDEGDGGGAGADSDPGDWT